MTGYYSLFLGAFILIAMLYRCLALKDTKFLKQCLLIFGIAFVFVYLFCPLYFSNFTDNYHMYETKNAANFWNFSSFRSYGVFLFNYLSKFIFNNAVFFMILLVLYIIGVPVLNNNILKENETRNLSITVVTAFSWAYLICTIAPAHNFATVRYIIPAFPILGLVLAYIVYHLRILYVVFIIFITLITTAIPIFSDINANNSKYKCLGHMTYFTKNIHFNHNAEIYYSNNNEKRTTIILKNDGTWPFNLLHLKNNNTVRLEDKSH